tara:strand:+ start:2032 stop:2196 length:165 start_codon:yes stop_codon:yes gene_type:complete
LKIIKTILGINSYDINGVSYKHHLINNINAKINDLRITILLNVSKLYTSLINVI